MSTDRINRGILLAMVVIGAIAYVALYGHASPDFRLYVPFGLAFLVGLVIYDVVRTRKPRKR
jgi:hypothetical protein